MKDSKKGVMQQSLHIQCQGKTVTKSALLSDEGGLSLEIWPV